MADTKISEMAAADALDGTEKVPMLQGGGNVAADASDFVGFLQDNDPTLAGNSPVKAATQQAVKAAIAAALAGLSWKQQVRVATTAAGTLASSFENGDSVDGVTLATGDRILIKDQASGSENGIYVVNASGAPTRATDADSGAELINATVYVSEGAANADKQFTCTTNGPITLGSTSLAFGQSGTGAVSTVNGAAGAPIIRQALAIACSDETTALTTGSNKAKFINPYSTAFNVLAVVASLSTSQTGGSILTIDINEAGASILSTKLTIDNGETNSTSAATPAVISDGSIAAYAEIGIDIDQIGDGTAKGLKVYLIGYPTP